MVEKKQVEATIEKIITDTYNNLQQFLEEYPFIIIIGKYDHILGPRAIYSSVNIELDQQFIRNLLRDALNTKNKFVILDFNYFYSQIYKIEVNDINARGKKQLYSIILLRDIEYPLIPIIHFRRIELMFRKIGDDKILLDDENNFKKFFQELSENYMNKSEILPVEKFGLQIRSGINTVQGFCELILEDKKTENKISDDRIINYLEMMLDSCSDIIISLEKYLKNSLN
ncbi:MAG: hypothetical protein ACFFHD_01985 [Promethearchaeota archaeon]